MIYKVSYVISGTKQPGAIVNQEQAPTVGETIQLGNVQCKIVEIKDLIPPMGNFSYLHVTCKPLPEDES